jgi:hypothetical protein
MATHHAITSRYSLTIAAPFRNVAGSTIEDDEVSDQTAFTLPAQSNAFCGRSNRIDRWKGQLPGESLFDLAADP